MTTVNYRGVSKSGTGYLRMTDDGWLKKRIEGVWRRKKGKKKDGKMK